MTPFMGLLVTRVLPVLAIVFALWWVYDWIHDRGAASRDKEVAQLKAERDGYRNALEASRQTNRNQQEAYTNAMAEQRARHDAVVSELTAKLYQYMKDNRTLTRKLNEKLPQYVTAAGDAACVVPRGFVRYHDEAAHADSTGPAEALGLPSGGPADADAPSGVALSAVASTIGENYGECRERGEIIRKWQEWYPRMKKAWEDAAERQRNFQVVVPASP